MFIITKYILVEKMTYEVDNFGIVAHGLDIWYRKERKLFWIFRIVKKERFFGYFGSKRKHVFFILGVVKKARFFGHLGFEITKIARFSGYLGL